MNNNNQPIVRRKNTENYNIFQDYTQKILTKLYTGEKSSEKAKDINNLIVLLNWCFNTKNNFFISNFNKNLIHTVWDSYNKIKTNIINLDVLYNIEEILKDIPKENIKTLRFILLNYINNYDKILKDESNNNQNNINLLCEKATKESMQNCLVYMKNYVESLN